MFKPLRLSDQTTCISYLDPAIDHDQMTEDAWAEYIKKSINNPSIWRDLIKFKAGESPAVFVIGVVPPDELTRIHDECSLRKEDDRRDEELRWRCFLSGLRDIQNWQNEDGKPIPKRTIGGVEYVDPSWLKQTFIRGLRQVACSIGMHVYAFNQLTEDEIKN